MAVLFVIGEFTVINYQRIIFKGRFKQKIAIQIIYLSITFIFSRISEDCIADKIFLSHNHIQNLCISILSERGLLSLILFLVLGFVQGLNQMDNSWILLEKDLSLNFEQESDNMIKKFNFIKINLLHKFQISHFYL